MPYETLKGKFRLLDSLYGTSGKYENNFITLQTLLTL